VKVGNKHLAPASTPSREINSCPTSIQGSNESADKQAQDDAAWAREQSELNACWGQAAAVKCQRQAAEKPMSNDEIVLQMMDKLRHARDSWALRNRMAAERQAMEAKWAQAMEHEDFCRSTCDLAENRRGPLPGSEDLRLQADLQAMAAQIRAIADSAPAVRSR
jgi:hypothetical protein